jgi:hypothetical protein
VIAALRSNGWHGSMWRFPTAATRTPGRLMAPARTRAVRTDTPPSVWDREAMNSNRKRKPLDLFVEALTHPVRFR